MKPTILTQYIEQENHLHSQILDDNLPMDMLLAIQELNYRIYIMRTCQAFCHSAPITLDTNEMGFHYQLVSSLIQNLPNERKFGLKTDQNGQKQRATAAQILMTVIQDHCSRFANFVPNTQEHYKKSISNMINTILPVWLQYRDTYVKLEFEGRLKDNAESE